MSIVGEKQKLHTFCIEESPTVQEKKTQHIQLYRETQDLSLAPETS